VTKYTGPFPTTITGNTYTGIEVDDETFSGHLSNAERGFVIMLGAGQIAERRVMAFAVGHVWLRRFADIAQRSRFGRERSKGGHGLFPRRVIGSNRTFALYLITPSCGDGAMSAIVPTAEVATIHPKQAR
jgi:hypothetical protein